MLYKEFIYQLYTHNIQLTKNDKMKRVSLCKSWLDQNIQWKNSVFTDEKAFSLNGPDNCFVSNICIHLLILHIDKVIGNIFKRFKRQCQGGKLMFWGAVFSNGFIYVE